MHYYITVDCHREFNKIVEFCRENETKKDDLLIILGDAGINYYLDNRDKELKKILFDLDITLFCVHGNHEARQTMGNWKLRGSCVERRSYICRGGIS